MILILLSFFLDSLLSNYFPYYAPFLSWLQPCFFVVAIVVLFHYEKNEKSFIRQGILFTTLGSLIFGNSLVLRLITFLLIYYFLKKFKNRYHINLTIFLIYLVISIFIYYFTHYVLFIFLENNNISFYIFTYQYLHSLILNLIIGSILYILVIKKLVR